MVYILLVEQTHDLYGWFCNLWILPKYRMHSGEKNKDRLLTVSAERKPLSIKEDCVFGWRWRVKRSETQLQVSQDWFILGC